jgi:sarcosine oxidase subunit beta
MVEYPAVIGGAFCSTDGFIAPLKILEGYQTAAMRSGVRCLYDCRPLKFHKEADRITGVLTTQGVVSCGAVVNAAGAWANEVAKLAGLEIPVQPLKRQVAITEPTGVLPEDMPMTIFVGDGFHLRVRNGRVLFLWPDHHESLNEYDTDVSDEWIAQVSERAHARLPVLRSVAIDRANCWAGLYEMTPDKHALLGPAPEFKNFYLINGSSGHGVMHSPALGQLLSEIVTEGKALTLDVSALRPTRFAEGHPNPVSDVL